MTPERYQKICDLFAAAREVAPAARGAFLNERCGADEDLRREVESLLASDESADDFIAAPALELAAEIVAAEEKEGKVGRRIGQYEIERLIGAGGMGEVWLAADERLKRRVALKILSGVQAPERLARFEQEAFAVSALNHPNIITIFDIGESDGAQFIATEYINGKTLREMLREKPLSVTEAVEIALQVCTALEAAHEAGIIHRDIKPENIMVRSDRIVKVLDFGLARFSEKNNSNPHAKYITKPGVVMGTVAYMSPEQARAQTADERTDIFSLGIVLFEMLTGRQPFSGANDIDTLAAILEREPAELDVNLPDSLREIVYRALRKNPAERYSAVEMAQRLRAVKRNLEITSEFINQRTLVNSHNEETVELRALTGADARAARGTEKIVSASSGWSARRKIIAALVLLALAAVSLTAFYLKQDPPVLSAADKILIADFVNKTGDEDFDGTLRQPLAVGLAQSPFLTLPADGQIRQTLKEMERRPDEPLTFDVAREIAQRRGIKAFLTSAIETYGVRYRITLEAFKTETGERVAREQAEAKNKEEVLGALTEAAQKMRARLGESLASIEKFDTPIQNATTRSLEALKAYTLANKNLNDGKIEEAVLLFRRAVELDPDFAAAYAALGTAFYNRQQFSTAAEYAEKAFTLRERTTEREKLKIADFYYAVVTGEADKNIETLEIFKQTYPRDFIPIVNLGETYMRLGKFAKAEENARLAASLDGTHFVPYANLGKALNRLGRFDEARAVFEEMRRREFTSTQINTGIFTAAFAKNDEAEMQRQLEELRKKEEDTALMLAGNPAIFGGRFSEYARLLNQAIGKAEKDAPDIAADYAAQAAVNAAALEKCAEAKTFAERALKFDRGQAILTDAAFALALCGNGAAAEPLIAELKEKYPKNTVVNSIWLPLIRAAAESGTSPERALETLEINRQFEGASYFWDNYLRGKIYLKLNKPEQAAAEFQKIAQNRGWAVHSPLFALAHGELARIFELQTDAENARKYSEIFAAFWKDADTDLPARRQVKAK